jgi:nitrate reductase assembly molybdenum cofactor insertion protein NarJ
MVEFIKANSLYILQSDYCLLFIFQKCQLCFNKHIFGDVRVVGYVFLTGCFGTEKN